MRLALRKKLAAKTYRDPRKRCERDFAAVGIINLRRKAKRCVGTGGRQYGVHAWAAKKRHAGAHLAVEQIRKTHRNSNAGKLDRL